MNAWEMPQVQALGEERLRLMQEAAEKCRGKSGMERLDIFLEYGEKLSEGGPLAPEEQKALLAAVAASLPEQEQKQLAKEAREKLRAQKKADREKERAEKRAAIHQKFEDFKARL